MIRILVTDDSEGARRHLAAAAQVPGAEVVTASSAREAIQKIEEDSFAVVVTDLRLETSEAGLDVLRAAKEKDSHSQVILVTAYGTREISIEAMRLGAFDYLEKNSVATDSLALTKTKVFQALEHRKMSEISSGALSMFGAPRRDVTWPSVFVVMPFESNLQDVYEDHIKKAVKLAGLDAGRADDFFTAGDIMKKIWSAIHASEWVIADCTGRSPNVFYEVGIAHAIGRETILITQNLDDIPFDLRRLEVIHYHFNPRGMQAFEATLTKALRNGKAAPEHPEQSRSNAAGLP